MIVSAVTCGMLRNGLWLALIRSTVTGTPASTIASAIICCTATGTAASFSHTMYDTRTSLHASRVTAVNAADFGCGTTCVAQNAASSGGRSL